MLRSRPPGPGPHARRASGRRPNGAGVLLPAVLIALLVLPAPGGGQEDPTGLRLGLTLGGISFVGLTFEYQWTSSRSVDVTVGTWAFSDVSLSVVAKQYLGPRGIQPFVGAGLWGVTAFTEEGTGGVLVLRAPVGLDWKVIEENYLGAAVNINRGLWVERADPDDDTPLNERFVPLPGFYYRWRP